MMPHEIEDYRKQLAKILTKKGHGDCMSTNGKEELLDLAEKVGASTHTVYIDVHGQKRVIAGVEISELAYNIHQALQTASMANMCETASRGYDIAVSATTNAKWTAVVAGIVSCLSMVAAWYAALCR